MSTLSELTAKLREYMKVDPNDKIWTTLAKESAINAGYFQVQKDGNLKWPENEATWTMNTQGGVQEYAINTYLTDFLRADMVQFTDTAGFINPYTKSAALRNSLSGNARPSNYYLFGGKIGFYPAPDVSYSVRILGRKKLPTLTSSVDSDFPEEFDDAIVAYAGYKLWSTTKNPAKREQALQDYKGFIQDLKLTHLFQDTADISFPYQRANERRNKYDSKILY